MRYTRVHTISFRANSNWRMVRVAVSLAYVVDNAHIVYVCVPSCGTRVCVGTGDVVLNNLKLRTDALKSLNLPVRVRAGFLGSLRLKVPWRALGMEPVIVELDRIFLLAVPETFDDDDDDDEHDGEDDDVHKAATRAKLNAIARGEKEWLDAMSSRSKQQHGKDADAPGGEKQSYVKAYIETILGNLQVSISNVHIRYEDFSTSSHPFRAGITLDQITAFTVDDAGEKTFVSSNALERLLKSAQLRRLAVYFDTDVSGDKEADRIRDVPTEDWDEFFMPGIHDDASVEGKRQFVFRPIDCGLTYKRLGAREMQRKGDSAEPKQSFRFKMDTLRAQVSEPQVRDLRTLLDFVAAAKVRSRHADLRPHRSPRRNPRAWWKYAITVVMRQYCIRRLSWTEVSRIAGIRRAYTASFYSLLKHRAVSSKSQKDKEIISEYEDDIKKLEADLPVETAVWFRVLVHMQMIREKKAEEKKAAKAETTSRSDGGGWTSWFSYVKSQPQEPKEEVTTAETPRSDVLTPEEQAELDRLMGVDDVAKAQGDDDDDDPYKVRIAIDAVVNSLALKLVDGNGDEVAHSYMKLARSCVSLFSETMDMSLHTSEYGMSMETGLQIQAGVNNDSAIEDTLDIKFTLKPQDKPVDSALAVVMAPIYVTFEKPALDRLQAFLLSGADDDANRNLAALEAVAVQQLGDVAGQAQEQVKSALSNDSRFELNLNIAAPKIALPIRGANDAIVEHLLLDLGQFKCITTDLPATSSAEERAVYERIGLFGENTCVFHAGPDFVWGSGGSGSQRGVESYIVEELNFSVIFDAGTVQRSSSPELPHNRVFVDIPSIKLHFSPARYRPIASLLNSFQATAEDDDSEGANRTYLPWASADYETACSILQKDGLGLGGAYQWLEKWAVLKADKLYILDAPSSTTSFATYSLGIGRKAMPMPTDMIGVDFAIAIADVDARGFNAVLGNKSSLIMRLDSRATATLWLSSVRAAITRFADSLRANDDALKALDAAGDLSRSESMASSSFVSTASMRDDISIECTLSTVDASIYSPLADDCAAGIGSDQSEPPPSSITGGAGGSLAAAREERLLVVVRALGTSVEFRSRPYEMDLGAKMTSMTVEDCLKTAMLGSKAYLLRPFDAQITEMVLSRVDTGDEEFFDALEETSESPSPRRLSRTRSQLGHGTVQVVMTSRDPDGSADFAGVVTEVGVTLGSVIVCCHRPTLLTLIQLGDKFSSASKPPAPATADHTEAVEAGAAARAHGDAIQQTVLNETNKDDDGRVSFRLSLLIERTDVSLDYEDMSNFALLSLQSLRVGLDIETSRLRVHVSLGNLRVCDGRVDEKHSYRWVVDLLRSDSKSLIELEFTTNDVAETRRSGFSSVFRCKISPVRIIYLHRFFVVEMLDYVFKALGLDDASADPSVDGNDDDIRTAGSITPATTLPMASTPSQLASKPTPDTGARPPIPSSHASSVSETRVEAVQLDIVLESPTILIPAHTDSDDCLEMQLGELRITNEVCKYTCRRPDGSAVHVRERSSSDIAYDAISIVLKGTNINVLENGIRSLPLVENGLQLSVELRRRLLGPSTVIPDIDVESNISDIDIRLSQSEYAICVSSISSNIFETPRVPAAASEAALRSASSVSSASQSSSVTPLRRKSSSGSRRTSNASFLVANAEGDDTSLQSDAAASKEGTTFRLQLAMNRALLTLSDDGPMCAVEMAKLSVGVRTMVAGTLLVTADIAAFAVYDMRNSNDSRLERPMMRPRGDLSAQKSMNLFKLEYASSEKQDRVSIQLQQLVVVAEMDFILSVAQFFVPTLFEVASLMPVPVYSGDFSDPKLKETSDILLDGNFVARSDTFLSAKRRILADSPLTDSFVFDGQGTHIYLPLIVGDTFEADHEAADVPIIVVGYGKTLRFKNVTIHGASLLPYITVLSQNSTVSVDAADGVRLVEYADDIDASLADNTRHAQSSDQDVVADVAADETSAALPAKDFAFDLVATGLRLQLLESKTDVQDTVEVQTDVAVSLTLSGDDQWANVNLRSLEACSESAGSPAQHILEPADIIVKFANVSESMNLQVSTSSLNVQISPYALNLFGNLFDSVMTPLTAQSKAITAKCYRFERIFPVALPVAHMASSAGSEASAFVSIWRPIVPHGYARFGDCCVIGSKPPLDEVYALNDASGYGVAPESFTLMWHSIGGSENGGGNDEAVAIHIWKPVAPEGYRALGMVASIGPDPPALETVRCLREELVVSASVGAFSQFDMQGADGVVGSLWTVENIGMTFMFAGTAAERPCASSLLDFRIPQNGLTCTIATLIAGNAEQEHAALSTNTTTTVATSARSRGTDESAGHRTSHPPPIPRTVRIATKPTSTKIVKTMSEFSRLWWSKGSGCRPLSIWRPMVPPGCVSIGDTISTSYMPPSSTIVLHKLNLRSKLGSDSGASAAPAIQPPIAFELVWRNDGMKGERLYIWRPKAPPGYVTLGCVASRSLHEPEYDVVSCVRIDLVQEKHISVADILWDNRELVSGGVMGAAAVATNTITTSSSSVGGMSTSQGEMSIWALDMSAATFTVQSSYQPPDKLNSFELSIEQIEGVSKPLDKMAVDISIHNVSCQLFGGTKSKPLLELELRQPHTALRGSANEVQATFTFGMAIYTFNLSLEVWEPALERTDFILKFENVDELATGASVPGTRIRAMATSEFNFTISEAAVGVVLDAANGFMTSSSRSLSTSLETMYDNQFGQTLYLSVDHGGPNASIAEVPSGTRTSVPRALPKRIERMSEQKRAARYGVYVHVRALRGLERTRNDNFGTHPSIIASVCIAGGDTMPITTPAATISNDDGSFSWDKAALILDIPPEFWVSSSASSLTQDDDDDVLIVELRVIDLAASAGIGEELGRCEIEFSRKYLERNIAAHQTREVVEYGEMWLDLEPSSMHVRYDDDIALLVETSVVSAESLVPMEKDNAQSTDVNRTYNYAISLSKDGPWARQASFYELTMGKPKAAFLLNDDVIVLEKGVNDESNVEVDRFRAAAVIRNNLEFDLEVALSYPEQSSLEFALVKSTTSSEVAEEIFENERFQPLIGWGSKFPGHLLPVDRRRYSSRSGFKSQQSFPKFALPKGWTWVDEWSICDAEGCDEDGWSYFFDFTSCTWPPPADAGERKMNHLVRRRRWVRHRRSELQAQDRGRGGGPILPTATSDDHLLPLGVLAAGSTMPLPGGCLSKGNGAAFLIRPRGNVAYNWSDSVGSSQRAINDLGDISTGVGFLACAPFEDPVITAAGDASSKMTNLTNVTSNARTHPFWISVDIGADTMPLASMETVEDFQINLNPVLYLDNALPYAVTFAIFEKQRGQSAMRQLAVLPCKKASKIALTCVDPRRSVYMSMNIDAMNCRWPPSRSPVLIRDASPSSSSSSAARTADKVMCVSLSSAIGADMRVRVTQAQESMKANTVRVSAPLWLTNNTGAMLFFTAEPKPRTNTKDDGTMAHRGETTRYLRCSPVPEKLPDERFVIAGARSVYAPVTTAGAENTQIRMRLGTGGASPPISIQENIGVATVVESVCENGESHQVVVTIDVGTGDLQDTIFVTVDPHLVVSNRTGMALEIRQVIPTASGRLDGHHAMALDGLSGARDAVISWARGATVESGGMMQIREAGPGKETSAWSEPFRVVYPGGAEFYLARGNGSGTDDVDATATNSPTREAFRIVVQLRSPGQLRLLIETAFARPQYALANLSSTALNYRQSGRGDRMWTTIAPFSCHAYAWDVPHGPMSIDVRSVLAPDTVQKLSLRQKHLLAKRKRLALRELEGITSSVKDENGVMMIRFLDEDVSHAVDIIGANRVDPYSTPDGASSLSFALQIFAMTISVVDKTPEELILFSVEELMVEYSMGSFDSRIGFRVKSVQLDDQLRFSHAPTMFFVVKDGSRLSSDFIRGSIIISSGGTRRVVAIPYFGLEKSGLVLLSIYEPVVWRLLSFATDCMKQISSVFVEDEGAKKIESSDRMLQVSTLTLPDLAVRFSYRTSVTPIERGDVGGFASVGLSLANIEGAKIAVRGLTLESVTMSESALFKMVIDNVVKQLMAQSLTLLTNYAYLDNTSKALSQASTGFARISMDENYQKERQLATTSQIGGMADGILDGSEALAKGIFHGVAGIFTKPVEGAKRQGLKGFVKGVGKGVIGAAAKPVAGVFDFASKTTEGISASVESLSYGLSDNIKVGGRSRKRLSRAISGDRVLRPFSEYEAIGQHALWACEKGSYFGKDDIFKTKGDFSNDRYECHMEVADDCVFMLTNCRTMMLKKSKRGSIVHYPCTVLWTIPWNEVLSIELRTKVGEPAGKPSIFAILLKDADGTYASRGKAPEHIVECHAGTTQAPELRLLCLKVMDHFYQGPLLKTGRQSSNADLVASAGAGAGAAAGAIVGATVLAPIAPISIPVCVAIGSVIGGYTGAIKGSEKVERKKSSAGVLNAAASTALPDLLTSGRSSSSLSSATSTARRRGSGGASDMNAMDGDGGDNDTTREDGNEDGDAASSATFAYATSHRFVWTSAGIKGGTMDEISIWRPTAPPGFVALADTLQVGVLEPNQKSLVVRADLKVRVGPEFIPALLPAEDYELVWRSTNSGSARPLTLWRPLPPRDYVALGCVSVPSIDRPDGVQYVAHCLHMSLAYKSSVFDSPLWELTRSTATRGAHHISLFQVDNDCNSFIGKRIFERVPIDVYGVDTDICKTKFIVDTKRRELVRQFGSVHEGRDVTPPVPQIPELTDKR